MKKIETHPFEPFVPQGMRILMCGTFPPPAKRWSMQFYYPNWINDMWRIWGYIYASDKDYFVDAQHKTFRLDKIKQFCSEIGLGMSDTGHRVHRQRDNASDKFLEIVEPFDLDAILAVAPNCHSIVVTGQLAADTLTALVGGEALEIGKPQTVNYKGRELALWRMPSSSRAYPKPIEWKAECYRKVLDYENEKA